MSKYDHEDENVRQTEWCVVEIQGELTWAQEDALQNFMDASHDAFVEEIKKAQASLSLVYGQEISWDCASDVVYLRTRSRWSEAHERELIRLYIVGTPPNIMEWPLDVMEND